MFAMRSLALASLAAIMVAWPVWAPRAQQTPNQNRLDQFGDLLPEGAISRFGTLRLRAYVHKFTFAPDGKTFASGGQDWDPAIRIWEIATGKQVRHWNGHAGEILFLSYLDEGEKLASAGADGTLRIWETATGRQLHSIQLDSRLSSATLAADRRSWITVDVGNNVRVSDLTTGNAIASPSSVLKSNDAIVLCLNGSRLATFGADNRILVWDTLTSKQLCQIATKQKILAARKKTVAFSPEGKRIATLGSDASIIEWDAETGAELGRYKGTTSTATELTYSPDGRRLAANSTNGLLQIWDTASYQKCGQLNVGIWGVRNMAFSTDSKLVAATQGAVIRLWDWGENKEIGVCDGPTTPINDLVVTPDGRSAITCERNGNVRRFAVASGKGMLTWRRPSESNLKTLPLPDGTGVIATMSYGFQRMDFGTAGNVSRTLVSRPDLRLTCRAISADGKLLASIGGDNVIRIWDTQTGQAMGEVNDLKGPFKGLATSSDGALLAVCNSGKPVSI
jgi:WD40 repeat protein